MRKQAFKVTASGRELLAALLETGQGLEITRVCVGSGQIEEGVDLSEMTELIHYEAEGAIAERSHEGNRFYLTVQYASSMTRGKEAFYLDEFLVTAKHPVTGEDVALLYGSLGDLRQPVMAWSDVLPPSVYNYPLIIVVADEIEVKVSATAGLVTYEELDQAVQQVAKEKLEPLVSNINKKADITIPAELWALSEGGEYPCAARVPCTLARAEDMPFVVLDRESLAVAGKCGVGSVADAVEGAILMYARKLPQGEMRATVWLMTQGSGGGGGEGMIQPLQPATANQLGGVKVGTGLSVEADGTLSLDRKIVMTADDLADEEKVKEAVAAILDGDEA